LEAEGEILRGRKGFFSEERKQRTFDFAVADTREAGEIFSSHVGCFLLGRTAFF
jgi:hypothetical protein